MDLYTFSRRECHVQCTGGGVLNKTQNLFLRWFCRILVTLQQYPQLYEGRQCTIHAYNLENEGNEIFKLEGFLKDVLFIIPDTTTLLAVQTSRVCAKEAFANNLDDTVIIEATTGTILNKNKMNPMHLLHLSNDGKRGIDGTLRVFDLSTFSVLHDFQERYQDTGARKYKYRAKITRDGKFAVWITEHDAMLKVADVETGQLVGEALTHALPHTIEVSDNNVVAVGCDDGRIMLLEIWPPERPEKELAFEERLRNLIAYDVSRAQMDSVGRASLHRAHRNSACCEIL